MNRVDHQPSVPDLLKNRTGFHEINDHVEGKVTEGKWFRETIYGDLIELPVEQINWAAYEEKTYVGEYSLLSRILAVALAIPLVTLFIPWVRSHVFDHGLALHVFTQRVPERMQPGVQRVEEMAGERLPSYEESKELPLAGAELDPQQTPEYEVEELEAGVPYEVLEEVELNAPPEEPEVGPDAKLPQYGE